MKICNEILNIRTPNGELSLYGTGMAFQMAVTRFNNKRLNGIL